MNETKGNIILIITMFLIGMCVTGGTYAYWTWNSTVSKNVVFNTAGLSDSVVYKEGSSHFVGDFQPSSNFCGGLSTTISFYKKSEASNAPIVAGINMDINRVEHSIANSNSVYWVLTSGGSGLSTTSSVCTAGLNSSIVLAYGTFKDYRDNTTISLLSNIDVPLLESDGTYTIWIWINSDGGDLGSLSGMTLDTNIWSQIDVIDEEDYAKKAVVYNLLGGTGAPLIQYKGDGETVSISSIEPVRTGYMFNGWNTKSDGTGTSYSAGTTYSTNADLTLYAVWSKITNTFANYITNLYETNTATTVVQNGVTYYRNTTNLIMNDGFGQGGTTDSNGGNLRYYGANPNNYVKFNCTTYPSTNCETWRIVGVFSVDGVRKVKLIRVGHIGEYSWDTRADANDSNAWHGYNNWSEATLMKLLNGGYTGDGGSLYYNAQSGKCLGLQGATLYDCSFTSTGLKNDATRNLIAPTTHYLGGFEIDGSDFYHYVNEFYIRERSNNVYAGNPTTWNGKVALAYPSDYGYAADLSSCAHYLGNYDLCQSKNWMFNVLGKGEAVYHLLTPNDDENWHVSYVQGDGKMGSGSATYLNQRIVPTVYLGDLVERAGGTGTSSDPFTLKLG